MRCQSGVLVSWKWQGTDQAHTNMNTLGQCCKKNFIAPWSSKKIPYCCRRPLLHRKQGLRPLYFLHAQFFALTAAAASALLLCRRRGFVALVCAANGFTWTCNQESCYCLFWPLLSCFASLTPNCCTVYATKRLVPIPYLSISVPRSFYYWYVTCMSLD